MDEWANSKLTSASVAERVSARCQTIRMKIQVTCHYHGKRFARALVLRKRTYEPYEPNGPSIS